MKRSYSSTEWIRIKGTVEREREGGTPTAELKAKMEVYLHKQVWEGMGRGKRGKLDILKDGLGWVNEGRKDHGFGLG